MKSKTNANIKTLAIWCFLAATILASSVTAFADQEKYIGFWKPGTGNNKILKFDTWEEFTDEWPSLIRKT